MQKQEVMWEKQHEVAADKIYNMCSDLGGFFLKVLLLLIQGFKLYNNSAVNFYTINLM